MSNKNNTFKLQFLAVLFSLVLVGCDGLSSEPHVREISGNITIGPEWTVIEVDPPLRVRSKSNDVTFDIYNAMSWIVEENSDPNKTWDELVAENKLPEWTLKTPEGQVVKMDVQLITDQGKTFDLVPGMQSQYGIGFHYFNYQRDPNQPTLPKDSQFTKIKVRSDMSIAVKKISWFTYTMH